jgi:hypothetical protein
MMFWSVFAANSRFLVKQKATPLDFETKFEFFLKSKKTDIRDQSIWNLGVTTKKYGVLVCFCPQTGDFQEKKNHSLTPMDFAPKIDFFNP